MAATTLNLRTGMARKRHAKLPTEYRVLQAVQGKDRQGRPRRGFWLTLPVGECLSLGWEPGDVVKVRRVGRHLELHKRGEDGDWASQRR